MAQLKLRNTEVKGTKKLLAGLEWLTSLGPGEHRLPATELRANICDERTPAGTVLRSCLDKTAGYTVGVKSTSFRVDADRLFDLRQKYGLDPTLPPVLTSPRAKLRYLATVNLNPFASGIPRTSGKRVGSRYYTVVTSMEAEVRAALIGHGFDYDITASMATLLYQRYLQAGGAVLPTWARLVTDRTSFRAELAAFSGMPVAKVKTIIASLLNGGQLVRHRENSIWQIYRTGFARVEWEDFVKHPLLRGLIDEGKVLYNLLIPKDERTRGKKIKADGTETSRVKSRGWHQYRLYEQIEDEVMSVVSVVLGDDDVWYVHDGFMRREQLSREKFTELISRVKAETGFEIELEETELAVG